ncbi:MAG: PorT family protein [Prevotella sp.]|nr:PorT family protein [Prevotella sp.]
MKKQDWTNDLRSKLSDYQAPLPEGLWEDIEASLPQALPSGHRSLIPWKKWTAAAAIAVALMGGGAYLWHQYGVDTPNDNTTLASADKLVRQESSIPQNETIIEEPKAPITRPNASTTSPSVSTTSPIEPIMPIEPITPSESTITPSEPALAKAESTPTTPQSSESSDVILPSKLDLPAITPHRKSSDPLAIGLFASNDAFSFTNSAPVINYAMTNGSHFYDDSDQQKSIRLADYEEKTKHHHPISIGAQVKFGLARNLAISTGLAYTYLKSDFIYKMGGTTLERNQVLQYLGVPVNVIYSLWNRYGLSVYTTAGAQADFCVKATFESEGTKKDIDKDNAQFSAMFGVGLQYDFTPSLGIYVEPSLRYYFDNGSDLDNAYKDKPTNIGFQFGLRYNISK